MCTHPNLGQLDPGPGDSMLARLRPRPVKSPSTSVGASTGNDDSPFDVQDDLKKYACYVGASRDSELLFLFHLDGLTKSQRLMWGLPNDATQLHIRLKHKNGQTAAGKSAPPPSTSTGFYVYTVAKNQRWPQAPLIYRHTGRPWTNAGLVCDGAGANVLTFVVARELYLDLGAETARPLPRSSTVRYIVDSVLGLLGDDRPANWCVVCRGDLGVALKVYRATACANEACRETFEGAPLSVRLSPMLLEPSVLDFLLCTVYSVLDEVSYGRIAFRKWQAPVNDDDEADELGLCPEPQPRADRRPGAIRREASVKAAEGMEQSADVDDDEDWATSARYWRSQLLPNCPIRLADLQPTIDSFPRLRRRVKSLHELLGKGGAEDLGDDEADDGADDEGRRLRRRRRMLLSWLVNEFRGCLVPIPNRAVVPAIPGKRGFMLLNSAPEQYDAFAQKLHGSRKDAAGSGGGDNALGGWAAFHGTTPGRVFNILREGLKDTRNEASPGLSATSTADGIFVSPIAGYSLQYTGHGNLALRSWRMSKVPDSAIGVVFGCELAQRNQPEFNGWEYVFWDEEAIAVRYVFMLYYDDKWVNWEPTGSFYGPPGEQTLPVMEDVYRQFYAGELLDG